MDAVNYLHGEGLLKITALGGVFSVTHEGRSEVERTLLDPSGGTEHFSPSVIQIFNNDNSTSNTTHTTVHGNVGANVVGSNNTTNVSQTVNTALVTQARQQLAELRKAAEEISNADQRQEADEILIEWDEAIQTNDKSLVRRLPREKKRLQEYFTLSNVTAAVGLVETVAPLVEKLLG